MKFRLSPSSGRKIYGDILKYSVHDFEIKKKGKDEICL